MDPLEWRSIRDGDLAVQRFSFGGTPLGGRHVYQDVDEEQAFETVRAAYRSGIRCFDTAPFYGLGQGEMRLGGAIAKFSRQELVISSKVGRFLVPCPPDQNPDGAPFTPVFDYSYDATFRQIDETLERMRLSRLDIVYIHDIDGRTAFDQAFAGAYRALERLRDEGQVSAIGAGLADLDSAVQFAERTSLDVLMLACRYTLLEQPALQELMPICEMRGISVVVAAPFNSGILATGPVAGARHNYSAADAAALHRVNRLKKVCDAHDVPLRAAALQFPLAHQAVAGVVVGSRSPAEIEDNLALMRRPIPPELWASLKGEGLIDPAAPTPC